MKKLITVLLLVFLSIGVSAQFIRHDGKFVRSADGTFLRNSTGSGGNGGGYCSEYQAIYDVMTTPPSSDTAAFQNTMVKSLVDDGYWTNRIDLLYVFATRLEADALRNWANVGNYNCTEVGAGNLTFTPYQGFVGDGTNYLNTSYVPLTDTTNPSLNSTTIGVYIRTNVAEEAYDIGAGSTGTVISLTSRWSNDICYTGIHQASISTTASIDSRGFWMHSRRGSSEAEIYRNGGSLDNNPTVSVSQVNADFHILTRNGHAGNTTRGTAIVIYMNGTSDADVSAINTIIETYMDAIGSGIQ